MGTRRSINRFMLLGLAILLPVILPAQKDSLTMVAAGVDYLSSGNTHGGFVRLFGGVERRRNLFAGGPMLQLGSGKLNGVRLTYSRNVSAAPERSRPDPKGRYRYDAVQLNFVAFVQYIHNAPLSPFVEKEEETIARGPKRTFGDVRMSTAETGLGIEFRLNLAHNLSWYNNVCISTHLHTRYDSGLSRGRMAVTLGLASGLLFVLY
jgi:hypothetical protein